MDVSEQKYVEKLLFETFMTQDKSHGKDINQNISARSLTLLIFAVGCMGTVWSATTQTRVSDATAVTFSVKCFNPLKLYPVSRNIYRKLFASYLLFTHEHLIM